MPKNEDPDKAKLLSRMRLVAGGLLGLMFLLFLGANRFEALYPWLAYPKAFAEAALVGGIADWFAVTALFRRPFGLPIPHTAIVPRNQARIADALGNFVAGNFLDPDVVLPRLKDLSIARRLADWLMVPAHAKKIASRAGTVLPALLDALAEEPVRSMMRDALAGRLKDMNAGPLLSRLLAGLTAENRHLALLDLGLTTLEDFVSGRREEIRNGLATSKRWWVPGWVDARLAERIVDGLMQTLQAMQVPDHPWRGDFQNFVLDLARRLAEDRELGAAIERVKSRLLARPDMARTLSGLIEDWREETRADPSRLIAGLALLLAGLAARLDADAALRGAVDGWAVRGMTRLVLPNREALGAFVAGVVKGWDTRTLTVKLELQVGRDLQFIRLNGTLVGGLVGLIVHALAALVG